MESNVIAIRGLCKHYRDFSLDHLDLDLPAGCVLGLVGENGAGKSTTIRLIMDALERDGGTVSVLGVDNKSPAFMDVKQDVGVVLDETCVPEVINARQQDMAVGKQADEQRVDQVALPDDDFADFAAQRVDEDRFAFDAFVEFLDVDDFAHGMFLFRLFAGFVLSTHPRRNYCKTNKITLKKSRFPPIFPYRAMGRTLIRMA